MYGGENDVAAQLVTQIVAVLYLESDEIIKLPRYPEA